MRLIDVDRFIKSLSNFDLPTDTINACELRIMLYTEPKVDAVPVVRCKDCKYFQQLNRCSVRTESYSDPNGYCHLGVRKEEEENEAD